MLEVRKNTYARNYENTFFRELAKYLSASFAESGRSGLLIGSPFCEVDERLQIDALLITERVVCIIDFKNYSGTINLPGESNFEFGIWTNANGDQIRGGSSVNPFIQLKNQKRRFSDVYRRNVQKRFDIKDIFNPSHAVRIVCFQEEVKLNGKIPSLEALNFFILDKINFLEGLLDITDVSDNEVFISPQSYDAFKCIFRADEFKIEDKPFVDKQSIFSEKSRVIDDINLYPDQKEALNEIKKFLEDPEQQVFVLQGTTNSGKSFLIPLIQKIAYDAGIGETGIFAASSRVANNLIAAGGLERVNSIYSYIYGGQKLHKEENEKDTVEENFDQLGEITDSDEELEVEEIPLKNCDNADDALFIVDESQLISDSFNQSFDLIFGTGYLLKDFLTFTNFTHSKRKTIFIGDPFQLLLGKSDQSPLNPQYLEEVYGLKTSAYQLLDKPDFSIINKRALNCVKSIRAKYFNLLRFELDANFVFLTKEAVLETVTNAIKQKSDFHVLCFTNEKSQSVNLWIKKNILNNGSVLAEGDLLLFNNNISIAKENDPFAKPKWIVNGQFGIVVTVSADPYLEETKPVLGELTRLEFRFIQMALDSGDVVDVLSLENYRLNPKAELSKNELVLFKKILNAELGKVRKAKPFDSSPEFQNLKSDNIFKKYYSENSELLQRLIKGTSRKKSLTDDEEHLKQIVTKAKSAYRAAIERDLRNDPSTHYYKLRNAALLRWGWAMTVHKSMSYKWDEVIFNVEKPGITNESHFRWLYTGISRSSKKVSLINYKPISPFDGTEFIDNNSGVTVNNFFYIAESSELEKRLAELRNFILSKIADTKAEIEKIENLSWQERYHFKKNGSITIVSFFYNGQGKFRFPSLSGGDVVLGNEIIGQLKSKNSSMDFRIIKDAWRRNQYELLSTILQSHNIRFSQIIQGSYKDKVKLFGDLSEESDLEIDYNGDGAFSKITAKYYSSPSIWEKFIASVGKIKEAL